MSSWTRNWRYMVGFSILMTSVYLQSGLWQGQKLMVIAEFEAGMTSGKGSIPKQHDQSASIQNRFAANTKPLVTAFQEMGNPFYEDSDEFISLIPRRLCHRKLSEVVPSIVCAHEEGGKATLSLCESAWSLKLSRSTNLSRRKKSPFPATDTKHKCAASMWTAQRMTCTYLDSSTSHCKSEKAMLTVCLKLNTLMHHHPCPRMGSWGVGKRQTWSIVCKQTHHLTMVKLMWNLLMVPTWFTPWA